MTEHEVLGVRIDDLDLQTLENQLRGWLKEDRAHTIVTPNPEFVLAAQKDSVFCDRLNHADVSLPDGVGLRFAVAALTDSKLSHRHTGVETLLLLAKLCQEQGQRLMLLGGKSGSGFGDAAAKALRDSLPELDVVVLDPGTVKIGKSMDMESIASLEPVVVAVALGQGKQEWFMEELRAHVPSLRIAIGVGGAFELIGGGLTRAPERMRRTGFEWLWRLVQQPSRFKRIFRATIVFPVTVISATLKRRRFFKAVRRVVPEILAQLKGI